MHAYFSNNFCKIFMLHMVHNLLKYYENCYAGDQINRLSY